MDLQKFRIKVKKPLRRATLLFLFDDKKILLAMKKRGFGKGRWNGVGGKPQTGESIVAAAKREAKEEIRILPLNIKQAAKLNFYFPYVPIREDWNQQVVVYLCNNWEGKPKETDEMKPKWYLKNNLPFDKMWADDSLWLPHVMAGKYVTADFYFDKDQKILEYKIHIK